VSKADDRAKESQELVYYLALQSYQIAQFVTKTVNAIIRAYGSHGYFMVNRSQEMRVGGGITTVIGYLKD
jgi:hypothetical protein